ncbi:MULTISPECIES: mechanosensitive ion channel domain-containing protein [unclassified Leeuwenhoekiella]|uniref:mechanosensitive ion channel family protein n=1 Tax=unclassified Leeuwenhoekiella TaxID=2615029 RepID=UPI000C629599|nr:MULTISPECIES: mechanosensitive ion channel domain-containing protein [unclassified Leeuwenhoekiella]MAW95205.1 mechanosensitive ion channel protein [Leeuwenhoekiella sp.]MBA81872.1 mechanosensitive ion channel protein [Leeuwenhoekiella sp.]
MKINQPILFLILLFYTSLNAQKIDDTTSQQSGKMLPESKATVPEKGNYGVNALKEYNDAYYVVNRLNNTIGLPPNEFNFQSPQSTLEHFIVNARNNNFKDASYALNLNLLPDNLTPEQAATLAEKLYFVLNQRVSIDWGSLSDRPDGQIDISTTTNKAIAGKPLRSVVFGEISLDGIDVVLRLQRIKYKDYGAFWLISANTVENIDALYEAYGPRELDRMMPDWARIKFMSMPVWKFAGTLLLILLAYLLGRFSLFVLRKLFRKSKQVWVNTIAKRLATPAAWAIGVLFFYITLNKLISFGGSFASTLYAILLIAVIGTITWFIMRFIDSFMVYFAETRIGDADPEENSEARMMMTYISVARRVITFIVIIVGIAVILSQFRSLEKLGISLIASAGLATVILGVAAQSTLGNIIAGIQIAITRPARIGDTVIINDDWGYVEDIRFTYMVVRTWDQRRLIVPLKTIISHTFENWSMTSAHQIRPIILHADYQIDVSKIRSKFEEILKNNENWDEEYPPKVQVVDTTEKGIKIRALCSAKDASTTWDLHCELREELVSYICELESGKHLSKMRLQFENEPEIDDSENSRKKKKSKKKKSKQDTQEEKTDSKEKGAND